MLQSPLSFVSPAASPRTVAGASRTRPSLVGLAPDSIACLHPPFQIDDDIGGTVAVVEMLLPSQEPTIDDQPVLHLLPALAKSWHTGEVTARADNNGTNLGRHVPWDV